MKFLKCKESSCTKKTIFFTEFCLDHTQKKEELIKDIYNFINKNTDLKGFNFSYIPFDEIDFSKKNLSFSIFSHSSMKNTNFNKAIAVSTFFDFSDLSNASFVEAKINFSVFGGAILNNAKFEEANINFSNFLGAELTNVSFNNSDIRYSRFINSIVGKNNFTFYNSNLKKTVFHNLILDEKSLKTSNPQDAIIIDCKCQNCDLKDYLI